MGLGHVQGLAQGQGVHAPGQDQNQGEGQNPGRDQGRVSDHHLDQSHHSPLNKYLLEGGQMACVEESATLPLSGAGRVMADSGAPLTGNRTPHLTDIGTPTGDGLDLTVLQGDGKETTIAQIGAAAGVEGETMATVTAATQLHPVEEALGENLSGIMTETETGTALTVMLLKGMKSSETTNMGTSEITSTVTSGTTSIETITIGKAGRGKDNHRTFGIATRGTIQGMVAGHLTGSNRAMATMRRETRAVVLGGSA